jgi:diguanylate cyclase (GGDEF)-like protein
MVRRADAALYAAKEAGRNCMHWHDGQKIVPVDDEEEQVTSPPEAAEPLDEADDGIVERLADDLPPLLSRTAFCHDVRTRMAEWKRGGPTLSLVLVEIDHFEDLVRARSARFREQLMASLARVILAGVREMDTVARFRAGCLGFLLPSATLADATDVAERIREAASQTTFTFQGAKIGYTVSVGLTEIGMAEDLIALFDKAELALTAGRQHDG